MCRKVLDMQPRAIETRYKGYRFRSRLEARWATFFDYLNMRWEYEPEGFELPSGKYLPDFYLPDVGKGLWVEIKATTPSAQEMAKLWDLVKATGKAGTFRVGQPMVNVDLASGDDRYSDDAWVYESHQDPESGETEIGGDGPYLFCLCPWCGKVGFEFDGRGARVCGYKAHYETQAQALEAIKHLGHWRADDKCYTGHHGRILSAALEARSARFEHGERGARRG